VKFKSHATICAGGVLKFPYSDQHLFLLNIINYKITTLSSIFMKHSVSHSAAYLKYKSEGGANKSSNFGMSASQRLHVESFDNYYKANSKCYGKFSQPSPEFLN